MFAPVSHRYGNVTQDGIHVPLTRDASAGRASAAWFLRLCAFCAESEKTAKFPEKRHREKGPARRVRELLGQCLMSQFLWLQSVGPGGAVLRQASQRAGGRRTAAPACGPSFALWRFEELSQPAWQWSISERERGLDRSRAAAEGSKKQARDEGQSPT